MIEGLALAALENAEGCARFGLRKEAGAEANRSARR